MLVSHEIERLFVRPLAAAGELWVVILAGGEGTRLSSLTTALHGHPLPKQFATLVGEHSLLQQTLLRARALVPWRRMVVVATAAHAPLAREQTAALGPAAVLVQPANLGTGPGMLLPLTHIRNLDAAARVLVLPSDHHITRPAVFNQALAHMSAADLDGHLVLLGAEPDGPESDYGWIVPGSMLDAGPPPLHRVERFSEKPAPREAAALMSQGGLWNTFVLAGDIWSFWLALERHLPEQAAHFAALEGDLTSLRGREALRELYPAVTPADFSRTVLAANSGLAVASAPACGWSDWGTPQRVFDSLAGTPGLDQLRRRILRRALSAAPEQIARA